jgi:hypothetical protein
MAPSSRNSLFERDLSERTIVKFRNIQLAAILPLLLFVVLLFYFRGSGLGILAFFILFIIGILVPQVYRDMIRSHLVLKEQIEKIREQKAGK